MPTGYTKGELKVTQTITLTFASGWPRAVARPRLPQSRTCALTHTFLIYGFATGRQAEWIAIAGGRGYLSSKRLNRSHVIPRSRFLRDNQRRQVLTTHRRNVPQQLRVAGDSVVGAVSAQLSAQCLLLLDQRFVQVDRGTIG